MRDNDVRRSTTAAILSDFAYRVEAMIARSVLRCSATRRLAGRQLRSVPAKSRRYSSTSATSSTNTPPQASVLGAFADQLDRIAPRFDIDGSQIQVLKTPSDFYEALKSRIRNAKTRIFLSTLYIGKTEHELVCQEAMPNDLPLMPIDHYFARGPSSESESQT